MYNLLYACMVVGMELGLVGLAGSYITFVVLNGNETNKFSPQNLDYRQFVKVL